MVLVRLLAQSEHTSFIRWQQEILNCANLKLLKKLSGTDVHLVFTAECYNIWDLLIKILQDGAVIKGIQVKSTQVQFPAHTWGLEPSVAPAPASFWLLQASATHVVYMHACRQNTHKTHFKKPKYIFFKNKTLKFKKRSEGWDRVRVWSDANCQNKVKAPGDLFHYSLC